MVCCAGRLADANERGRPGAARPPRVTSAVAIGPEYLPAFGGFPEKMKVLLVSLGSGDGPPRCAQAIPSAVIPDAFIFDAFAACSNAGPAILADEDGDAAICNSSAKARETVHQEVAQKIIFFLARNRE